MLHGTYVKKREDQISVETTLALSFLKAVLEGSPTLILQSVTGYVHDTQYYSPSLDTFMIPNPFIFHPHIYSPYGLY
jgi:hypothetical protein